MTHQNICPTDATVIAPVPQMASQVTGAVEVFLDQTGRACAVVRDKGNPYALGIGSAALNAILRRRARTLGKGLKPSQLDEINDRLVEEAEEAGRTHQVWSRVAKVEDGIEIDLGNEAHTRIRITNGATTILNEGSDIIFRQYAHSRSMVMPKLEGQGELSLLKRYVNLDDVSMMLLRAWLGYTLANPKVPSSKYVILQIIGGQGTGKSVLTKLIKRLIDPAVTDAQMMPTDPKDLAIASQQAHVLSYDNLRYLTKKMSDNLCITATGGTMGGRQLYTDGEQHVLQLHAALVLNGIHPFVGEPDLAERCLTLHLKPIPSEKRKSEVQMAESLECDLPIILRGLLDLIAAVLVELPQVEVTLPERMMDFSRWLAAMEVVEGVPPGIYQGAYSSVLNEGQRDTLMDNPLASNVLEFFEGIDECIWSGTPTQLLNQLNFLEGGAGAKRLRDWPENPAALSKRLMGLQAALSSQGINVELTRGKERKITITKKNGDIQ